MGDDLQADDSLDQAECREDIESDDQDGGNQNKPVRKHRYDPVDDGDEDVNAPRWLDVRITQRQNRQLPSQ